MLGWMPCSAKRVVYSAQAYCTPRSEWWMSAPAQTEEIVRAHQPQHALVVHRPAVAAHELGEPAIPVVPLGDGQPLEHIAERGLLGPGRRRVPMPVVCRPAHAGEGTQAFDRQRALRRRHRLDHGEDVPAPRPALGGADALMCRKARAKKSSSTACWPILRSRSAIRSDSAT